MSPADQRSNHACGLLPGTATQPPFLQSDRPSLRGTSPTRSERPVAASGAGGYLRRLQARGSRSFSTSLMAKPRIPKKITNMKTVASHRWFLWSSRPIPSEVSKAGEPASDYRLVPSLPPLRTRHKGASRGQRERARRKAGVACSRVHGRARGNPRLGAGGATCTRGSGAAAPPLGSFLARCRSGALQARRCPFATLAGRWGAKGVEGYTTRRSCVFRPKYTAPPTLARRPSPSLPRR